MSNYPGGYQIVDFGGRTLTNPSSTFEDKKIADTLRNARKPLVLTGLKHNAQDIIATGVLTADTGAVDGKVFAFVVMGYMCALSTNDNTVTVTMQAL